MISVMFPFSPCCFSTFSVSCSYYSNNGSSVLDVVVLFSSFHIYIYFLPVLKFLALNTYFNSMTTLTVEQLYLWKQNKVSPPFLCLFEFVYDDLF